MLVATVRAGAASITVAELGPAAAVHSELRDSSPSSSSAPPSEGAPGLARDA